MMRHVYIVPKAKADIRQILGWLRSRTSKGTASWWRAFLATTERTADHPESYPIVAEANARWTRDVRQELFQTRRGRPYRIVFTWSDDEVRILRVRGSGQRPLRSRDLPKE